MVLQIQLGDHHGRRGPAWADRHNPAIFVPTICDVKWVHASICPHRKRWGTGRIPELSSRRKPGTSVGALTERLDSRLRGNDRKMARSKTDVPYRRKTRTPAVAGVTIPTHVVQQIWTRPGGPPTTCYQLSSRRKPGTSVGALTARLDSRLRGNDKKEKMARPSSNPTYGRRSHYLICISFSFSLVSGEYHKSMKRWIDCCSRRLISSKIGSCIRRLIAANARRSIPL